MSNKLTTSFLLLLLSIVAIAQPSKKMLNRIPKEAYCTFSINTTNIAEKVNFDHIKSLPVIKTTFDELKKGARKDSTALKKFYDNPNSLGIAMEPSITTFFHVTEVENEYPIGFMAAAIPLSNGVKFEILLKNMLQGKYEQVKQGKGYKYMPDNRFVMAWNKKVVVFYLTFSSNGKHLLDDHLERFFKADPKKSLMTNTYFKEFSERKKDFGVWLDPKRGLELYKEMMGRYGIFSNDQLGLNKIEPKISSIELDINFNDGHISFATRSKIDDELKPLTEKTYAARIDREMLKYVSTENLYGITGFSTDIKATHDYYQGEHKTLYDSLYNIYSRKIIESFVSEDSIIQGWRDQLYGAELVEEAAYEAEEEVFINESVEELEEDKLSSEQRDSLRDLISTRRDSLEKYYYDGRDSIIGHYLGKYDLNQNDLWNIFTGDVLMSSNGTFEILDTFRTYEYIENQDGEWTYEEVEKTRTYPAPLLKMLVGINYPESIDKVLKDLFAFAAEKDQSFIYSKKDDYYEIEVGDYTTIYVGILANKYLLITNNEDFVKNIGEKGYDSNLANTTTYDYLTKDSPSFFYLDISKTLKITEKGAPQQVDLLRIFQEAFTNLTVTSNLENSNPLIETKINMGGKNNSLEQLFELANDIFLYYRSFR